MDFAALRLPEDWGVPTVADASPDVWQQVKIAALSGDAGAAFRLGNLMSFCSIVPAIRRQGREWLEFAAGLGSRPAAALLSTKRFRKIRGTGAVDFPGEDFIRYLQILGERGENDFRDMPAELDGFWEIFRRSEFSDFDDAEEEGRVSEDPGDELELYDFAVKNPPESPVAVYLENKISETAAPALSRQVGAYCFLCDTDNLPDFCEEFCRHILRVCPDDSPMYWLALAVLVGWVPAWMRFALLLNRCRRRELRDVSIQLITTLAEINWLPAAEALAELREAQGDWRAALAWWGRAADLQSAKAGEKIAALYENPAGKNFPKNEDVLNELFAEAGYAEAQFALARREYLKHPANHVGAECFARRAARRGHAGAMQLLEILERTRDGTKEARLRRLQNRGGAEKDDMATSGVGGYPDDFSKNDRSSPAGGNLAGDSDKSAGRQELRVVSSPAVSPIGGNLRHVIVPETELAGTGAETNTLANF